MSFHKSPKLKQLLIRYIIWPIETVLLGLILLILRIMPVDFASILTGWIGSKIGPLSDWHKRAKANLELAMPELSEKKQEEILSAMWWNLGRNIGEFPHLPNLLSASKRVEIQGLEKIKDTEKGCVIIAAHQANWETSLAIMMRIDRKKGIIYRPLNNPLANYFAKRRQSYLNAKMFLKGREAAHGMISTLKANGIIGLLIDQQLREGKMVPFFGIPAKTATAHIKIASKLQINLFPAETIRIKGAYFKIIVHDPISVKKNASNDEILEIAEQLNNQVESWIKTRPEHSLWPHRRWGKIKL